jgi:dTDP-3,4-didehydro-2,6-dideoxy-alpha-D-glucose 3-reductase
MNLAIVGFGNHVNRNVLPTLSLLKKVHIGVIVVRDVSKYQELPFKFTTNYREVLRDNSIDAVYIASPISSHFEYAKQALLAGKPVLCEKALTEDLSKTEELVQLSLKTGVKLQEVVMYQYHRQFSWVRQYFESFKEGQLVKVSSCFRIPHLKPSDIRYKASEGGGALLDVGFYPISFILSLLGEPTKIHSYTARNPRFEVDLGGSALMEYNGFFAQADWGIGGIYQNKSTIEWEEKKITIDRSFSKPNGLQTTCEIEENGIPSEKIVINPDDHFRNLFQDFFADTAPQEAHLSTIIQRAKIANTVKNNHCA